MSYEGTTYVESYSEPMSSSGYGSKRSRSRSRSYSKRRRAMGTSRYSSRTVPRSLGSNSCIIPLTVDDNVNFATDPAFGYGWSPFALWRNGVSYLAIPGQADMAAVFDMARVVKVEITILPGNNVLDYGTNSLSTGQRQIPYVYDAYDPNSSGNPTLAEMREHATCRVNSLTKPIRRTIYPNLGMYGNVVNVGQTRKDLFVPTAVDLPAFGWKVLMDVQQETLPYCIARISFKVFFECRNSK